jgi:ABC-type transporter MlaC component
MLELLMIRRSLLLSAFVLLSSIMGVAPRSLAATDDPASIVGDLGTRALAAMRNGDTAAVQGRFRQPFRQYFDAEACGRSALGPHWQNTTAQQRQDYADRYEDYIVIVYSTLLSHCRASPVRLRCGRKRVQIEQCARHWRTINEEMFFRQVPAART